MLERVAIFSKDSTPRTREGVQRLVNELCARGIRIQLHLRNSDEHKSCTGELIEKFTDIGSLSVMPDLIMSVGGDGTFLETVMKVRDTGIPVAGVNTGRMGFLANIPGDDISSSLDLLCKGDYEIVERTLLQVLRPENLFVPGTATALNEFTIQKSNLSMITIHVYADDVFLNTYWADGIIVSTATGSTAYNLSAGGPILSPDDESIIISPISPHNLTIRPIVLSGKGSLKLKMEGRTRECLATCDSLYTRVPIESEIELRRSSSRMKTVMLPGRDFYSTLRSKLMWGIDKRN